MGSFGFGREELDITDERQVHEKVLSIKPDIIIHTAAYTQVDQAESDEATAFKVNAEGTKYLAQAAEAVGAKCKVLITFLMEQKILHIKRMIKRILRLYTVNQN